MNKIKVKICGICNLEDANLAASLGADYIGLNFYKESPRKVSLKMAKDIIALLPPFTLPVAVFVDEPIGDLVKLLAKTGFDAVQLHGSETPEYCKEVKEKTNIKVIKAFRISDEASVEAAIAYLECCDYFLFDAYVPGEPGGTGEVFNWDLVLTMKVKGINKPFFLAGGLTPENVGMAIEKVEPFGVDTASGVERLPKKKDFEKMKQFIREARGL
jgi:phosphoribosylanthranilate isomerase